ncbi:DNA-processing protein DprA [uncultured Bifidobacterium sp.]|uniref:DNA-processing protein DprA n=1 Tax=uncultured Bifidobacterium sp. TaxID=165187 RepID=UPI0028DB1A62|nr:DNA-processing protein DprA [uncultured Bifidobacterium sp.]
MSRDVTANDRITANRSFSTDDAGIPATGLDDETLSRATLCRCADGPDALLQALVLGMGTADETLACLADLDVPAGADATGGRIAGARASGLTTTVPTTTSGDGLDRLEDAFTTGVRRWGGRMDPRGLAAFHRALARWRTVLESLPHGDRGELARLLTDDGRQWIVAPHHALWPHRLDDLSLKRDWATPLCLWGQGDPRILVACESPVAIVGSRGCDDYGRRTASRLAERLAGDGHVIISGGAMGTDAAAHWGSLRSRGSASGTTIAVIAGGLDHAGPRTNMALFTRIVGSSGALVSELPPGTIPLARRFLLRNRIIAALAGTVIVAQARLRSGALNTAGWGAELGRVVYAVPGRIDSPNNAGCNRLIRDGAAILLDSLDAVDEPCGHGRHPSPEAVTDASGTGPDDAPGTDPDEDRLDAAILSLAGRRSRPAQGITREELMTRLRRRMGAAAPDMSGLLSALGRLELEGRLVSGPAGLFTPSTGSGKDRPSASPAPHGTPATLSQGRLPLL